MLTAPAPVSLRSALPVRHAVCGYTVRGAQYRGKVESLCGRPVSLPLVRYEPDQKCPECLERSEVHAVNCECFKLSPNARMPR